MILSGMYAHIASVSQIQFKPKIKGHLQGWSFFPFCCYMDNIINNSHPELKGSTPLLSNNKIITAKKGILIVDDDLDIANLYKLSLERDGFVVDAFNDPLSALSNYKIGTYDLLLIDIKMPKMNGFELYQKHSTMGDIPKVCFITAFEEFNQEFKELFPNLKEKGCFLRKPIELQSLTRKKSELGYY